MANRSPVMRGHFRSHGCWCLGKRFRAAFQGRNRGPISIDPDEGQVMRRGRSATEKLYRRNRLGQLVAMPVHGRRSHLIVEIFVETWRNQPLNLVELACPPVQ